MGTTILYSSGDNGVAGNGGVCLNSQGMDICNMGLICTPRARLFNLRAALFS